MVVLPAMGWAQDQGGFDIQQFNPSPSQQVGFFNTPSGRVLNGGRYEVGLLFNYADDPLVLSGPDEERLASVVSAQAALNLVGAIGIADLVEIGLDVPLVVYQSGDEITQVPGADASDAGVGLGDIRVIPKIMLVGPDELSEPGGVALAFLVDTRIPTGDAEVYQGEDFRVEPKLALELGLGSAVRLGAAVGYMVRTADAELGNVEANDSLTWSVAGGFELVDDLELVPEVLGEAGILADELDDEELPLEALLGLKYTGLGGFLIEAGGGPGFIRGFGTPDFRVFAGITYAPEVVTDRDGDGIPDDEDACPDDPEDFDAFEDEDGCPDEDNDQDTILDVDDRCPNDAEDFDDFEDEDGCPDPDNDNDQILDVSDACPLDPEDRDQWQDEDGCPDPDNDEDQILDVDDACPNDPETYNGVEDTDGCPDQAILTCVNIEVSDRVHFDTDSDVIQRRSYGLLDSVANLLVSHPEVRSVRIEGHTDSRASDAYNLDLSQRRAESVMRYMIDHGVAADRLEAVGYGERQPVADNDTEEGMAQNRRVEFTVLEQEGCD